MVSNLTSVFRNRNNNNNQPDKKSKKQLSSSSEEQPPAAMVLVPTVTVQINKLPTIQEAPKEVEVSPSSPEPSNGPSSSSVVQEIPVEAAPAPEEELLKPETSEPSAEEICSVCSKIEGFVRPACEKVRAKVESLVNRLLDPALHASIRSEVLEYLPSFVLAFGIFFFCITVVSILKLLRFGAPTEPSFFCKYFAAPFSPLFDALCAPEPYVFAEELPRVIDGLLDEILITISELFRTISQGFSVFGTLFTAISNGLSRNVFFGFHELGENLGENIHHLIHFVTQFFHQIIHFFLSSFATLAGSIAGLFTALHDFLQPRVEVEAVW